MLINEIVWHSLNYYTRPMYSYTLVTTSYLWNIESGVPVSCSASKDVEYLDEKKIVSLMDWSFLNTGGEVGY